MGIKGIKKRVGCFMLAFSLSFGICATDYLEVQALEWAGTVIGLEEALKFLLGLLGVTVGVGVAENIDWQSVRENAIDYQIAQGQSAVAVSNWWADVIHGSLDTASQCWASFKDWVKNDLLSSSSASTGTFTARSVMNSLGATGSFPSDSVFDASVNLVLQTSTIEYRFYNCHSYTIGSTFIWNYESGDFYFTLHKSNGVWSVISQNNYTSSGSNYVYSFSNGWYYVIDDSLVTVNNTWLPFRDLDLGSSDVPVEGDFESAFSNVQDIALAPDIATDLPYEGVIDIPWENVGATDEAVGEAIDGAQEKVITGEWTLEQYWSWVQNVTNVFAYDITNNYLLPNDGNNETADDKVQENVNRGAFVLAGLEKVFPFCIPWDIYAFVTLLVADPVAPVIEYPIYNPVTKDEEVITIDFSVWEQQVIIMRYIMDFLLIIGLLLLARSLIGAGGSD